MDDVHFRPVIRVFRGSQLGVAAVDVLTEPHPAEPVAALDADAAIGGRIGEVADGADDLALIVVDPHQKMVNDCGPWFAVRGSRTANREPRLQLLYLIAQH